MKWLISLLIISCVFLVGCSGRVIMLNTGNVTQNISNSYYNVTQNNTINITNYVFNGTNTTNNITINNTYITNVTINNTYNNTYGSNVNGTFINVSRLISMGLVQLVNDTIFDSNTMIFNATTNNLTGSFGLNTSGNGSFTNMYAFNFYENGLDLSTLYNVNISNVNTSVNNLNTRVTGVATNITNLNLTITQHTTQISGMITNISNLNTTIKQLLLDNNTDLHNNTVVNFIQIKALDYMSGNGSLGINATCTSAIVVRNGLIIGCI